MNSTNIIWTNDDFEEYARQLQLIEDAYGDAMPMDCKRRRAADVVNHQKGII